jgi:Tfp pilus assembly protein PilW
VPVSRLHSSDGFTVVELLTAMLVGMVVLSALFGLLEVSLNSTGRVNDRTEANQQGRNAMEQMTQELASQICIKTSATSALAPVSYGDGQTVRFYTDITKSAATYPYTTAFSPEQRELSYNPATKALVEKQWAGVGTYPNLTFPAVTQTRTLLSNAVPQTSGGPIFTYYAYASDGTIDTTPLPVPLSATDRPRVVQVGIAYVVSPAKSGNYSPIKSSFQDTVQVRLPTDLKYPQNGPLCAV